MPRLLLVLPFTLLTACGSATDAVNKGVTPAKIQADTARYFSTSTKNVQVGNIQQTMLGTSYQARVSRVLYNCSQFRSAVSCDRAQSR
ncbi:MAG: hypothetical protein KJO42_13970 [Silicimonas sp.]|nr:hypothetical protein [Silicimonas sp.]MBT8424095.1 hypothetical protein [Silicimonas sp.]NNL72870.1 hypothetical protein [Silicimonas sp.]RZW05710.1 MAG: hypothetical protein EX266_08600 [Paracoccaceae bacterium]